MLAYVCVLLCLYKGAPLCVCMHVWMYMRTDVWIYAHRCMDVWVLCIPLTHSAVELETVVPSLPDCASLSVMFPDGCHVADCSQAAVEVGIMLEFCSSQPITLTGHLIFRDTNTGKK